MFKVMADLKKFDLKGIKEFEKNLLKLQEMTQSTRTGTRIIGKALSAGSTVLRKSMKGATAKKTGKLKKSLKSNDRKQRKRTRFAKITGFAFENNDPEKSYIGILEEGLFKNGNNEHKGKIEKSVDQVVNKVIKATLDKLSSEMKQEFKKFS